MAVNKTDYPGGAPTKEVRLTALGYDGRGHRGGGIVDPKAHLIPVGAVLLRLYMPSAAGRPPGDFGAWWFTPHEYDRICDYFGVDGRALIQGRADGKSALHGVLALLNEWYGNANTQLSYVNAVSTTAPIWCCYGPGAPANLDGYKRTLKPVRLSDGSSARQIYIHQCWLYAAAMKRLVPSKTKTDAVFGGPAGLPKEVELAKKLSFEPS